MFQTNFNYNPETPFELDNSGNIILGGILTECNEFSINLMTQENFDRYEYFEDADILNLKNGVVGGMLKILNTTGLIIR